MKKIFFLISLIMIAPSVYASGDGVPMGTVVSQIVNLGLLVGILFFTQRKTISQAFADKKENFLKSVNEASASKKAAEDKLAEVAGRVSQMKQTFAQQVAEAKNNAEESYRTQLADAKNEAVRLKTMSSTNLEFEVQKQVENLRIETFKKSADMAEKNLGKTLTPEQHKAWTSHFTAGKQGAH